MLISKYLIKIKSGKPINFDRFCLLLNESGYDNQTLLSIFSTEKISSTNYRVQIIDDEKFNELQTAFPEHVIKSRVSAALAGNSHKHPVSRSMIILWPYRQIHPIVILNDSNKITTPISLSRRLLIIENQENFLQKDLTLAFLKRQFPDFDDDAVDIAWGSGNAISNRLNKNFFNQYQRIDCLLDLDIGGLKIFANIYELTSHPRLSFLLPPIADELLKKSNLDLQAENLPDLRNLREKYPPISPVIELMVKHKKMLEQEIYLQD